MPVRTKTKLKMASSAVDGGGRIIENGVEEVKNTQPLDHWAFLDEIEAPMWADLNSCNLPNEDIDEQWFDTSHPFHQCSSRQLISTVFHSDKVGSSKSIFGIEEQSSPKFPSSVSKSRGKNYKSKEWGNSRCKTASNKQHPVKNLARKSARNTVSIDKEKPLSRTRKPRENEGPKACSSCESGVTDTSGPKFSKFHSNSLTVQEMESSSRSTVTSDQSDHQQKKCLDISVRTSSHTSGLLSSLKIGLRRSHATRPAARVEVKGGRQSEGSKSSSSKSSVGSSSHPGSTGKKSTLGEDTQMKVKTPDSRNITEIYQPPRNKMKVPNVLKAPALDVKYISNTRGSDTLASKVTARGKVQPQTLRQKVLMPRKVNEQSQITAKDAACRKSQSSAKAAPCMGPVQKASKQVLPKKNDREKLVGQQEKTKSRSRNKDSANAAQKIYFR